MALKCENSFSIVPSPYLVDPYLLSLTGPSVCEYYKNIVPCKRIFLLCSLMFQSTVSILATLSIQPSEETYPRFNVLCLFRPSSQYIPQSQIPVPESPSIVSGVKYNEWQRNSGLRVLRKVIDRQKLLEFESLNFASNGGGGKSKVKERIFCNFFTQNLIKIRMIFVTYLGWRWRRGHWNSNH